MHTVMKPSFKRECGNNKKIFVAQREVSLHSIKILRVERPSHVCSLDLTRLVSTLILFAVMR